MEKDWGPGGLTILYYSYSRYTLVRPKHSDNHPTITYIAKQFPSGTHMRQIVDQ